MRKLAKNLKKSNVEIQYVDDARTKTMATRERIVTEEQTVENNRIIKKKIIKEIDPRDNFKDYKVSDFFIENLEAVGALNNLKQTQFLDGNIDDVLDKLNELADKD